MINENICTIEPRCLTKNATINSGTGIKKDSSKQKINDLHSQFSEYGRNAKEWARKCILMLPAIDEYRVWRVKGFTCIHEYAAKIAGLSRGQVDEGLRILRKIEDKPALWRVVEQKGIWAVKPVATVATKETEAFWAEKAKSMTVRELEAYVKGALTLNGRHVAAGQPVGDFGNVAKKSTVGMVAKNFDRNRPPTETVEVKIQLSKETLDQLMKLKGTGEWEDAMKKLLSIRGKDLERGKPKPAESSRGGEKISRHVPTEIARYVRERDNNICVFPGCYRKYEELHHVDGFAFSGAHAPDRIFCLCDAHHRLAHHGLIVNEHLEPKCWRVRAEKIFGGDCENGENGKDGKAVGYCAGTSGRPLVDAMTTIYRRSWPRWGSPMGRNLEGRT